MPPGHPVHSRLIKVISIQSFAEKTYLLICYPNHEQIIVQTALHLVLILNPKLLYLYKEQNLKVEGLVAVFPFSPSCN